MSDLKIKNRADKFKTLTEEFFRAVEPLCADTLTLTGLKESLCALLKIDAQIQEWVRETYKDQSKTVLYREIEHDFTYAWLGLRQFCEPSPIHQQMLRRSSILTLEETRLSLIGVQEHFEGDSNPVPHLARIVSVLEGLDNFIRELHPSSLNL